MENINTNPALRRNFGHILRLGPAGGGVMQAFTGMGPQCSLARVRQHPPDISSKNATGPIIFSPLFTFHPNCHLLQAVAATSPEWQSALPCLPTWKLGTGSSLVMDKDPPDELWFLDLGAPSWTGMLREIHRGTGHAGGHTWLQWARMMASWASYLGVGVSLRVYIAGL